MKPVGLHTQTSLLRKEVKQMLIPTPLATILTGLACKALCEIVFNDKETRSPAERAMQGHDTFDMEIAEDMIRTALEEGEDDED